MVDLKVFAKEKNITPGNLKLQTSNLKLFHNPYVYTMKLHLITIFFLSYAAAAQDDHSIRDLKAGRVSGDSSYVYALPYEKGHSYLLIQAYDSKMSHKGGQFTLK
jgi:hypothetical protein